MAATTESPESRLYDAGFTRQLEFWLSPDGHRVLNLDDAVAALDGGHIKPTSQGFPDTGVRALPDELVDRICPPFVDGQPEPPPWLVAQAAMIAEVTAETLQPLIRAEVRAALRATHRSQASTPKGPAQ